MQEEYKHRKDCLYLRVTDCANDQITDYFRPGRPKALKGKLVTILRMSLFVCMYVCAYILYHVLCPNTFNNMHAKDSRKIKNKTEIPRVTDKE